MNPNIYKDYCNQIIELCDFAVKEHTELLKSLDNSNTLFELKKIKNFVKEFLNERKSIYFLGESSSGKSTFINHIFGDKIIPQSTKIETRVISKIQSSENKCILIKFKNSIENLNIESDLKKELIRRTPKESKKLKLSISDDLYVKLVKSNNKPGLINDANVFIDEVNICYPFTCFKNFVFYDTPGMFSGKSDTDDEVLETMFSKFSSYIFFLFDAGEPAQTKIRNQIKDFNKSILSKINNKRLIFLGTHLDELEKAFKSDNKDVKVLVENYKTDLRKFIDDLGIEYLDIFLISQTSRNNNDLNYTPLDLRNKVTLGELEHKINMHSYDLNNYFLQLVVNEPKNFIKEYIKDSFIKKIEDINNTINELNNDLDKNKIKYDKHIAEIKKHEYKSYFDDYLSGFGKTINKLLTEEERFFNPNIDKVENYINKYKTSIHTEIDNDHGGENCEYNKIKKEIKSRITNYGINLNPNKRTFFWDYLFKFLETSKEPFRNGVNSDVFHNFMIHHNKTKLECEKIIKQHYENIKLVYECNYNSGKVVIENKLIKYRSEVEIINKIKSEIEKKEEMCIKSLDEIKDKLIKLKNEKQNNVILRFLNDYRSIKQINN